MDYDLILKTAREVSRTHQTPVVVYRKAGTEPAVYGYDTMFAFNWASDAAKASRIVYEIVDERRRTQ